MAWSLHCTHSTHCGQTCITGAFRRCAWSVEWITGGCRHYILTTQRKWHGWNSLLTHWTPPGQQQHAHMRRCNWAVLAQMPSAQSLVWKWTRGECCFRMVANQTFWQANVCSTKYDATPRDTALWLWLPYATVQVRSSSGVPFDSMIFVQFVFAFAVTAVGNLAFDPVSDATKVSAPAEPHTLVHCWITGSARTEAPIRCWHHHWSHLSSNIQYSTLREVSAFRSSHLLRSTLVALRCRFCFRDYDRFVRGSSEDRGCAACYRTGDCGCVCGARAAR